VESEKKVTISLPFSFAVNLSSSHYNSGLQIDIISKPPRAFLVLGRGTGVTRRKRY